MNGISALIGGGMAADNSKFDFFVAGPMAINVIQDLMDNGMKCTLKIDVQIQRLFESWELNMAFI
jgi:hypothetical protein